jgi:hypothetical protein
MSLRTFSAMLAGQVTPEEVIQNAQKLIQSAAKKDAEKYGSGTDVYDVCLHKLIRRARGAGPKAHALQQLEATVLQETVMTDGLSKSYKETLEAAEEEILSGADVVFFTTTQSTSNRFRRVVAKPEKGGKRGRDSDKLHRFTSLVIDEAGMSMEADTLAAMACAVDHVALVGDHLQLQPVVESQAARRGGAAASLGSGMNGLGRSLFERLYTPLEKRKEGHTVMLRQQYRMHEQICEVSGEFRTRRAGVARVCAYGMRGCTPAHSQSPRRVPAAGPRHTTILLEG